MNSRVVASEHNQYRQLHNADDLKASFKLSIHAKNCVEWMLRENQDTSKHPCQPLQNDGEGENIYEAKGTGFQSDTMSVNSYAKMAIQIWYVFLILIFYPDDFSKIKISKINYRDNYVYELMVEILKT